jgi:hypothetical protein
VSISLFLIVKSTMKRVLFLCEVLHVMDVRGINVWEDLEGDLASGTGSLGRSLDSGIGSLADCIYAVWRGQTRSV